MYNLYLISPNCLFYWFVPTTCLIYLHLTLAGSVGSHLYAAYHMSLHFKPYNTLHRSIQLQTDIFLYIYI